MKKAILLISTGSPDSYRVRDIVKYLYRFLNDRRIISLPAWARFLVVCRTVLSSRSFRSSKRYRLLYDMNHGIFPLLLHCSLLKNRLEERLGADVFTGMCFGKPSIAGCLQAIADRGISRVMIIPMHPHYASSASGLSLEKAMKGLGRFPFVPEIVSISSFFREKGYIGAFVERIREYDYENFDAIVFSYHSLPLSHVKKWDAKYPGECAETTELICSELGITTAATCFQSQMTKKWLGPETKSTVLEMLRNGKKRILIVAPSFVSDCLETEVELGVELKNFFLQNGGEELQVVKSLNEHPAWVDFIVKKYNDLMN
ncbi:MAG: ferrochelatase [Prevotellaceae bacterium]|jgi:ferrochelatase|nr:ferrochelatase [Prevotellaceae bacterium]